MTKRFLLVVLLASAALAQTPTKADLVRRTDELQIAIAAGDWATARDRTLAAGATSFVDSFLTWLPPDTETLMVAQAPFTVVTDSREEIPTALETGRSFVLGLLESAENQTLAKALQGRTLTSAAVAARNFHGHKGPSLGLIAFEGCGVYNLADPMPESAMSSPPEDSVLGYRVWNSQGHMSESKELDNFFVTLLDPRMLAVCNDRKFLQELITRKGQPQSTRALPPQLQEWQLVDRSAPLWAVSHYVPNTIASRLTFGTDGPTGSIFFYGSSGTITSRVIANSDPWAELDDQYRQFLKSRKAGENLWELEVSATREAGAIGTLMVMGSVGFVVLI